MTYTYKWPRYKVTGDVVVCHYPYSSILILKRSAKVDLDAGKYSFPGGNMNPDELVIECAARELKEETGVDAVDLQLLNYYDALDRSHGDRSLSVVFYMIINEMIDIKLDHESADYHWITSAEVDAVDWAFDCKQMALDAFEKVYNS